MKKLLTLIVLTVVAIGCDNNDDLNDRYEALSDGTYRRVSNVKQYGGDETCQLTGINKTDHIKRAFINVPGTTNVFEILVNRWYCTSDSRKAYVEDVNGNLYITGIENVLLIAD